MWNVTDSLLFNFVSIIYVTIITLCINHPLIIIKIEIFVLLFCLIFADRHSTICFLISTHAEKKKKKKKKKKKERKKERILLFNCFK